MVSVSKLVTRNSMVNTLNLDLYKITYLPSLKEIGQFFEKLQQIHCHVWIHNMQLYFLKPEAIRVCNTLNVI